MNAPLTMDRRRFLQSTGFLALSFAIPGGSITRAFAQDAPAAVELPGDLEDYPMISSWLRINADGTVTLMIGKVELGQGVVTAVAQVCAEELDIDFGRLHVISGDTALVPDEGTTAGSQSMPNCAPAVQMASAEARQIMLELASARLGQPMDGMSVQDGTITAADGQSVTYWDLVTGSELEREATGTAPLKSPSDYRYIGHNVPRIDIPAKMTGGEIFVQEMNPEGRVFGKVVRPPTYRATLTSVDTSAVEAMPGVLAVVRNGSFLGVVAEREEQALAAMDALGRAAQWEVESILPGTDGMEAWLLSAPIARDIEIKNQVREGGGEVVQTLEASYYRPYHMHGSIGPSAAIAQLGEDGTLTIHTHSQSVFSTGEAIAAMLSMDPAKVRCIHTQGSGCYGHNNADDAAADAALLAMAVPGRPVKFQYTRAQEHKWEPYGSAMVMKTRAGVDADGNILDWNYELWSTPHGTRPGGNPGNLLSARYLDPPFEQPVPGNGGPPSYSADRNAIAIYEFPGHRAVTHFITEMPLRVSSTRGLGAYANVFAIESFIDELAHATGADPLEYRLRHLKDERGRAVLMRAAEVFGWDNYERAANRGRGIAFAQYKNFAGYCAVALECEVTPRNGRVRVLRAVAAAESGQPVSPDGIANQIEGGLIQSLSWTLKEEVRFDETRVMSEDWASYPILTFSEVPPVQVEVLVQPAAPYLGTGEASQGPSGAALANAVFDATGVRFRRIPLTPDRVRAALEGA
jgi:CO/xanthine dehydrogenase Mo-binding subunit